MKTIDSGFLPKRDDSTDGFAQRDLDGMLFRIVCLLESNASSRDDLMQEARVHVWQEMNRNPGQRVSWYLQSCKFHLQHQLFSGRSIDARKRAHTLVPVMPGSDETDEMAHAAAYEPDLVSEASSREIVRLLRNRLRPRQQAVLDGLVEGLGTCEIARKLAISHAAVAKHRRAIAILAGELGFTTQ